MWWTDAGRPLGAALATTALRRLQAAWTLSAVASWAFFVALSVHAYAAAGAAGVGAAALVRMLPAGLAAPLAGLAVDRLRRRDVLAAALIARAVLAGAVAAAIALGAPLTVVLTLAALFTVSCTAHRPAQAALLLDLAPTPAAVGAASALWTGIDNAAFLAGSLVGGALIATTSVQVAFAVTAGLYAAALLPLAGIPRDAAPVPAVAGPDSGRGTRRGRAAAVLADGVDGFRQVARVPDVRRVVGFVTGATLLEGAVDVLVVVTAIELLHLGPAGVAWLNAAWGLGGLAGGGAALALLGRGRLSLGLALGGLLVGLPLVALGAAPSTPLAVAALALLGVGYALVEAAGLSLLQRLSDGAVVGRAFAAVEAGYWLATGLGAVLAPPLIGLAGTRGALIACGALLPVTVVVRWRGLSRLEALVAVPEHEFATLRRLPIFATLPMATVEALARRVTARPVAPGEVVVRRGEPGHEFFAIADGRYDVAHAGGLAGPLGPGDGFGERALLHAAVRTATVTAREAGLLYVLDRDAFLTGVGAISRPLPLEEHA